jgi:hypothetical protein
MEVKLGGKGPKPVMTRVTTIASRVATKVTASIVATVHGLLSARDGIVSHLFYL